MSGDLPVATVTGKIHLIRDMKVLLDRDLADLYGVETSQLKRAVRRNIERFPPDFMFELVEGELENLRCQIGISSWGGTTYTPHGIYGTGVGHANGTRDIRSRVQGGDCNVGRDFPHRAGYLLAQGGGFQALAGEGWARAENQAEL